MSVLPSDRRPFLTFVASVAVLVLAVAGCAGCGGSDSSGSKTEPSGCTKVHGSSFTLVARNISWQPTCIEVEAGSTVAFTIKLEDQGVQHNLHIDGISGAKTKLQTGPITQHLTVHFPAAATSYGFKCDIHPDMTGTIYAVGAAS